MTNRLLSRAFLAALVAGLTLTAAAEASTGPLSATAYRQAASAICVKLNNTPNPTTGTAVQKLTLELNVARSSLTSLRALRPPATLASLHAQVTKVIGTGLDYFASLIAQLRSGKITLSTLVADINKRSDGNTEDALWAKIGATGCEAG